MKHCNSDRWTLPWKWLVLLFFLGSGFASGAETQVSISASNNLAFIGDQINLKFIVKTNHTRVEEIKVQTEKKDYEILGQQPTVKRQQTGYMVFEKNVTIAFFKVGNFEVGPFTVELVADNKVIESKTTNSVPVSIKSVLKEEDKDIKPLKGLIDIKGNPWFLLKYALMGLVLAGLLIFLIWWLKKRKKAALRPAKPLMSPLEELQLRLRQLTEKRLIEKGKLKLHFIELTQIIKGFLNRNYGFNAEDSTTEETLYYLRQKESEGLISDNLRFVFNTADLIKFAKFIPDAPVFAEVEEKIMEVMTRYKLRIQAESSPPANPGLPGPDLGQPTGGDRP
jgi:hypothetical protein